MSALSEVGGPGVAGLRSTVVGADEPEEMTGPMLDLTVMKEAMLRRWKAWVSMAIAGLVLGAAFHLFVPAKYTAVSDLYMVEPSGQSQAIDDDVSLLQTRAVAQQAVSALDLRVDPEKFLSTYSGLAVSDAILSIRISAASPGKAVAYDNAVAHAFLATRARQVRLETSLVVGGLNQQVSSLNAQANGLTKQINALSRTEAGPGSAGQLAALVTERSSDVAEIDQLKSQQQQDVLTEQETVRGSNVLDTAAATRSSAYKVTAMDGLSGLVGGLGLGLVIVIVGAAISERPRRRADVAAALGVRLEMSLGRYRSPRVLRKARMNGRLPMRWAEVEMVERRLRRHVGDDPGTGLGVVAVGPCELAALSTVRLACSLASEGRRVLVADMAEKRPLAWLFGVRAEPGTVVPVNFRGVEFSLLVAPADPAAITGRHEHDGAAVVLVLCTLDPGFGAEHLTAWVDSTVLVVTAGKATATRMSATTQMLRQAGIEITSALLVGAGPQDESIGAVSDDALRGALTWAPEKANGHDPGPVTARTSRAENVK